jgi:hypothetical protein
MVPVVIRTPHWAGPLNSEKSCELDEHFTAAV